MSVGPVVLNGMIQRTQDIGNLKQQEDNKPIVQQQNIGIQQERQEKHLKMYTISYVLQWALQLERVIMIPVWKHTRMNHMRMQSII